MSFGKMSSNLILLIPQMSFGQRLDDNYRQVQDSLGQLDRKIETSSIQLGRNILFWSVR